VPRASEIVLNLDVLKEEVNVKNVDWTSEGEYSVNLDLELSNELRQEGIAREVVRTIQNARKDAGLEVDDRINLSLVTLDAALSEAVESFKDYIKQETLTGALETITRSFSYTSTNKVNGADLELSLEKSEPLSV
jgi:isoleucyl-tRNA synthetase